MVPPSTAECHNVNHAKAYEAQASTRQNETKILPVKQLGPVLQDETNKGNRVQIG